MKAVAPRIEIHLGKIQHNARSLVTRLAAKGITVTGVTTAVQGSPAVARVLLRAGIKGIGDSRIGDIERMVRGRVNETFVLTRSPMPSEVDEVIRFADVSLNTELGVITQLSASAVQAERHHGIILMVELGDLREGLMPDDLAAAARTVIGLPNLYLQGIGCNLASYGGVSPDARKMAELSALASTLEKELDLGLHTISGGNSANLEWALSSAKPGRINNLRLGGAILLGRETLHRRAIDDLHTDAFSVVAEVIESKLKPSLPQGQLAHTTLGGAAPVTDRGLIWRSILAIGRQDTDPAGLTPPQGIQILGASSDHLIVESLDGQLAVGSEVAFAPDYSALLAAMTSPHMAHDYQSVGVPAQALAGGFLSR